MSKKLIDAELLRQHITSLLKHSTEKRKRKFTETVEIHFGLKNFDPARDKRLAGTTSLPFAARKKFKVLVFANEKHIDVCKELGYDYKSLEDLKKIGRDKRVVKKLGKSYDQLFASHNIIRQVPRILGPTLNRIGKFPAALKPNDDISEKVEQLKKGVKFQVKFKVGSPMCLSGPVGNVDMKVEELEANIMSTINYLVTLMKKGWQNVKKIHIKSTMGPTYTIYGFVVKSDN
jgi:large subunit ribosomal protein L10Ae